MITVRYTIQEISRICVANLNQNNFTKTRNHPKDILAKIKMLHSESAHQKTHYILCTILGIPKLSTLALVGEIPFALI